MSRTTSTIPVVAAAVALAACSSSSLHSSSASNSGRHTYAETMRDDVRFVRCLRSHRVSIANPTSPYEVKHWLISSAAQLPVNQSAEMDCQHLLPGGSGPDQEPAHTQAQLSAALAFARCMRARGFPSFPDPTSQGQLSPQMITAAGIDLHQPKLLRGGLACVHVTHGLLTPADVEQAVNGD